MTRIMLPISSLLAIAILTTGCASVPNAVPEPTVSAVSDCRQLGAEIARVEGEKRAALEKEQGAWKTVIPFVVVARYVSGKSAVGKADKDLGKMHAEFSRQGCSGHGI